MVAYGRNTTGKYAQCENTGRGVQVGVKVAVEVAVGVEVDVAIPPP
jgi:hypothetical protein